MARFLLAVWPLPGHYFPNLALARALMRRGHQVAVSTGAKGQPAVEAAGAVCLPFRHIDLEPFERVFYSSNREGSRWRPRLLAARDDYYDWIASTMDGQVLDVEEAIDAFEPDVVICDPTLWGPFLVLPERRATPFAIFCIVPFCPLAGAELAPPGPGLPPPRTPHARLQAMIFRALFRLATTRFRERANALRRAYDLPPLGMAPSQYAGRLPLYLVAGTREFDYGRSDVPESVHYVGPCLWTRERSEPAAWMREVREDQPWIHVTEGTVNTRPPLLSRAAARGLAGCQMQVIISTGARGPAANLGIGALAPNVRLEHWTDIHLQDLLPRTGVVVTAGGAGIVMAALQHGVPLVIAPSDWDKPEIAQRVAESGAGVRLRRRHWTPAGVRDAVERVIGDPSYTARARALAASFGRLDGPGEAAELLTRLAESRGRGTHEAASPVYATSTGWARESSVGS